MDNRLTLLSDYVSLATDVGGYHTDASIKSLNDQDKNRHTFVAYSLLSVYKMANLVTLGVKHKDMLLIFSGLRMLEENYANVTYVFSNKVKTDGYISKILQRGTEYQQAFTELRNKPELGIVHINSVGRWTGTNITERVHQLGEGPEFRYSLACKYLHSDIWTMLNDNQIKDLDGMIYGLVSLGVEDIQNTIDTIQSNLSTSKEYDERYNELANRTLEDFKNKPVQTYF